MACTQFIYICLFCLGFQTYEVVGTTRCYNSYTSSYQYCAYGCCNTYSYYDHDTCCAYSLTAGAIAGIILGCLFIVSCVAACIFCCVKGCGKSRAHVGVVQHQPGTAPVVVSNTTAFQTQPGAYPGPPPGAYPGGHPGMYPSTSYPPVGYSGYNQGPGMSNGLPGQAAPSIQQKSAGIDPPPAYM